MRIVIDTNIIFSAILNSNSKISKIILHPKSKFHFYSTNILEQELIKHKSKLLKLTNYSESELSFMIRLFLSKIKLIDVEIIPTKLLINAENLTYDVDIDDTEFIALTNHISGKFWSGDKELIRGLSHKNWKKFISTNELYKWNFKSIND